MEDGAKDGVLFHGFEAHGGEAQGVGAEGGAGGEDAEAFVAPAGAGGRWGTNPGGRPGRTAK